MSEPIDNRREIREIHMWIRLISFILICSVSKTEIYI